MRLDLMTWPEVEAYLKTSKTVVVPVGSTEQHGPTGVMGTDIICPEIIAKTATEIDPFLITPPLPFGQAQHHLDFAGTIALRPSTLIATVQDVVASLSHHGFQRIYFFNGHGGNTATLEAALAECYGAFSLRGEACPYRLKVRNWWELPGIFELCKRLFPRGHGGHGAPSELSVTHYAYDEAVRRDKPEPKIAPFGQDYSDARSFRAAYPDGRAGADPTLATKALGEQLVHQSAQALVRELQAFSA